MPNKQEGEVSIQLDKPRVLRFGLNAMAEFEDVMDLSLPYLLSQVQEVAKDDPAKAAKVFGFKHIRAMLWAALLHEDSGLTLNQAGDLVGHARGSGMFEKVTYVQGKVMEAFAAMQNPMDPNVQEAAQESARESGTGRPSKKQRMGTSG